MQCCVLNAYQYLYTAGLFGDFHCYRSRAYATYQEALKCDFENWRIWENFLAVSTYCGLFVAHVRHWISVCGCRLFDDQVASECQCNVWICIAHCCGHCSLVPHVNRIVINKRLQTASVTFGFQTGSGRLFHAVGPAVAKATGGHTCWVSAVICIADCGRLNSDAFGWKVAHSSWSDSLVVRASLSFSVFSFVQIHSVLFSATFVSFPNIWNVRVLQLLFLLHCYVEGYSGWQPDWFDTVGACCTSYSLLKPRICSVYLCTQIFLR